jgi:hypothetical protein
VIAPLAVVAVLSITAGCGRDSPPGARPSATTPASTPATVTPAPAAGVRLDTVHEYPPVTVPLAADQPATVEVADAADLADRLARSAALEAVITLSFDDPEALPDFSIVVFVNTPEADADTPTTAPGFIGTVSPADPGGRTDQPVLSVLPARSAVDRTDWSATLQVTLVPIPYPDRSTTRQAYEVTVAAAIVR